MTCSISKRPMVLVTAGVAEQGEEFSLDCSGETVHEVRLTRHSLIARIIGGKTLGVNSTHHQAVDRVAEPLMATAVSCDGVVEGLELRLRMAQWLPFLLSLQFHPERLVDRYGEHREIFRAFTQACGSPD